MNQNVPLIAAKNISFGYEEGALVIRNLSLEIYPGEKFVLVGPNGVGKTTLANLLVGLLSPGKGKIEYHSDLIRNDGTYRIGYVRQQLSVFPTLTVGEHFRLLDPTPDEVEFGGGHQNTVAESLAQVGARFQQSDLAGDLPFNSRQLLEIALALWRRARVLILDEPTSALDSASVDFLFRALDRMAKDGVAIILISHNPRDIERLGGAKTVILGDITSPHHRRTDSVRVPEITNRFSLRGPNAMPQLAIGGLRISIGRGQTMLLAFDDAFRRTAAWSVAVAPAGNHTSANDGISPQSIRAISSDRDRFGLFPDLSVWQNYVLLSGRRNVWHPMSLPAAVQSTIARYSIVAPSWHYPVSTLSGGNQQKLLLASILAAHPEAVLAEEPLLGLDHESRGNAMECLRDYLRQGGSLVLYTCFPDSYVELSPNVVTVAMEE